jgi:hypothetical protein
MLSKPWLPSPWSPADALLWRPQPSAECPSHGSTTEVFQRKGLDPNVMVQPQVEERQKRQATAAANQQVRRDNMVREDSRSRQGEEREERRDALNRGNRAVLQRRYVERARLYERAHAEQSGMAGTLFGTQF